MLWQTDTMEALLERLERRFGRYAPGNLTWYLVGLQGVVFFLEMLRPGTLALLQLDPARVRQGELWRLVTFALQPPSLQPFWLLFALYWLHTMGTALEQHWGAFRYTLYWLVGVLATTAMAFGFSLPAGSADNSYLLMSLFLAFATLWPDYKILVFFVLPVPVKWLALLDGVGLLYELSRLDGLQKLLPLVALGNYLLFFLPTLVGTLRGGVRQASRARAYQQFRHKLEDDAPRVRRCATCGVTDEDRSVDFRVCSCEACGGKPTDYCLAHATNHAPPADAPPAA
jgi:membrane associated rhomboid family serine protease